MKIYIYLILLIIPTTYLSAQEVQIEIEKLSKYSSTSWSIMDAYGQEIIASADFDEPEFIMTLDANTKFYFNINVENISKYDTSLYFVKLDNEPIILINNNLEIGNHSYPFFTGKKSPVLRIIGGSDASIEDYPWQVYFSSGDYMCGGTIISDTWILTAAHCVFDGNNNRISSTAMRIKAGTSYPYRSWLGEVYAVKNVIVHENYNVNGIEYDIAVLELAEAIDFENAEPLELISDEEVENGATAPGVFATVTGWGLTRVNPDLSTSVLQEVELPIVSNETASTIWGRIDQSILMAGYRNGGKDACSGDSGGPLVVDVDGEPKLAGIVSWGSEDCDTYGGFTRVSSFTNWIYNTTGIPRPIKLNAPAGLSSICDKETKYSYVTDSIETTNYEWNLLPSTAGTISYDGKESSITWNEDYYGIAQIKVRAELEDKYTSWSTTNVDILEPTNLYYEEGDTTICNKANASLFVSASGDDLTYSWYKNGEFVESTDNGFLNLNKADTTKTGTYYCDVIGTCGTLQSGNIEIIVHPTTEVYHTPDDQQTLQNENITLETQSFGHNLQYQWYKDGESIFTGGNLSYLDLTDVNATDIGQYWLEVEGTCGSDISDSIYIFVDIDEINEIAVKVWPTITENSVNITISDSNPYSVRIFNMSGEMVYAKEDETYQISVDVSFWPKGMYIVKIGAGKLEESTKIMKY